LAKARLDVQNAEAVVTHQQWLVAELGRDGHPTAQAEQLLVTFQTALERFRDRLRAVESES
jgi:hypothetical protein